MLAIESRHFPRHLSIGRPLFQIEPLVARVLALSHAELGLDPPVLPIKFQHDQGSPGDIRQAVELVDLLSMEKEFSDPLWIGNVVTRLRIRLDIGAIEKRLSVFDPGEGVANVRLAGTN